MRKTIAIIFLCCVSGICADAETNPLLGTWSAVSPATTAGPASVLYLTFRGDWSYEMRALVGTNAAGTGSGMAITDGNYELTGPNSINYWETRYQICPSGGYCADYPSPVGDFGKKKPGTFELVGDKQMKAEGLLWTRQ